MPLPANACLVLTAATLPLRSAVQANGRQEIGSCAAVDGLRKVAVPAMTQFSA